MDASAVTLTSFADLATELKLMVLESSPDLRTLHSLVLTSRDMRAIYEKHAYNVIERVLANSGSERCMFTSAMDAAIATKDMACTIDAEEHAYWTVGDVGSIFNPQSPRNRVLARGVVHERPFQILQRLANRVYEVDQLTDRCWTDRTPTDGKMNGLPAISEVAKSKADVSKAIWELRCTIDRHRHFDPEKSCEVGKTDGLVEPVPVGRLLPLWIGTLSDCNLVVLSHALKGLRAVYDGSTQSDERSLAMHLFGQRGGSERQVGFLPEKINAELVKRRICKAPRSGSVADAMAMMRAMALA